MKKTGVVAFAFGVPSSLPCNREIARMAYSKKHPIFTQADIQFDHLPGREVTYCKEVPGEPPPTLRIAREAVQWAKEREFNELWIACARPHRWRAKRDLIAAIEEAGLDIEVFVCLAVFNREVEWFSQASTQPRTQSAWAWYSRDVILWCMPFWVYKKVAS